MISPLVVTQFETFGWAWQQLRSPAFHVAQGVFLGVFGLKEIFWDSAKTSSIVPLPEDLKPQSNKIAGITIPLFLIKQADLFTKKFYQFHGVLFLSAGSATVLHALHHMEKVHLGVILPIVKGLEGGLFISACIVALVHNLHQYQLANNPAAKRLAILGIISCLSYIFWGAVTLFGGSITLAWLLCGMALGTGGLKIILEFVSNK